MVLRSFWFCILSMWQFKSIKRHENTLFNFHLQKEDQRILFFFNTIKSKPLFCWINMLILSYRYNEQWSPILTIVFKLCAVMCKFLKNDIKFFLKLLFSSTQRAHPYSALSLKSNVKCNGRWFCLLSNHRLFVSRLGSEPFKSMGPFNQWNRIHIQCLWNQIYSSSRFILYS